MNTKEQYKLAFAFSKQIWQEYITNGKTAKYKALKLELKSKQIDFIIWLKAERSRIEQLEIYPESLMKKIYRFNPEYNPIQIAKLIKKAYIRDIKEKYNR